MEKEKQSLQETVSKERENYKSVFLKKRSVCNRQSVYISGEIQKRICLLYTSDAADEL